MQSYKNAWSTRVLMRRWLQDSARALKRRYFLMMKAKDAARIGIVVATTSVAGYSEMVERLKSVIRAAGKRAYVFYVGKISPAKLANFAEMDALVMPCAAPPCCTLRARSASASCPRLPVSDSELTMHACYAHTGACGQSRDVCGGKCSGLLETAHNAHGVRNRAHQGAELDGGLRV